MSVVPRIDIELDLDKQPDPRGELRAVQDSVVEYAVKLFRDGAEVTPEGRTATLRLTNPAGTWVQSFAGSVEDGVLLVVADDLNSFGNMRFELELALGGVTSIPLYGRYVLSPKVPGGSSPAPVGGVIDWSLYSGYSNVGTHGPLLVDDETIEVKSTTAKGQPVLGVKDGVFEPKKLNNPNGSGVPGVNDDETEGYSFGSIWVDKSGSPSEIYKCVDATEGAAEWVNTSLTLEDLGSMALEDAGDYLAITAQAADVDPAGTAIAGALAGKVGKTGAQTMEGQLIISEVARRFRLRGTEASGLLAFENADGTVKFGQWIITPNGDVTFDCNAAQGGRFAFRTAPDGGGADFAVTIQGTGLLRALKGLEITDQTPSLPLALDANKRAVTLSAADFRTLIGLVIGTDVQAQNATLQALADAADDAERREAVGGAAPLTPTVNAQTGTSYTLALADAGAVVTATNADAVTVTVPTNAAIAYPVGTVINVLQVGAGAVTVEGDTGVTVNGVSAGSVTTTPQYQGVSLLKVGSDEWIVSGAADIPLATTEAPGLVELATTAETVAGEDGTRAVTPEGLNALIKDGLVLKAPNETLWKLTVNNDGNLITEEVV